MKAREKHRGSGRALFVLLGFVAAVFLTPVHLLHDQLHLVEHHESDARPISEHEHEHEGPAHEHHSPAEHEIVAVRSHNDAASPALPLAILIEALQDGGEPVAARFAPANACGPQRALSGPPAPSRAPPAL